MITRLKGNLAQAQARMKKYADLKRLERTFSVGDMVYLKLLPFRHQAFNIHQHLKLTTKYDGPIKILEKIGLVAYNLQLHVIAGVHPVFHVSHLKKHLGAKAIPEQDLPLVTEKGHIKYSPIAALDTRAVPRGDSVVTQWKIQWLNLPESQATWEDKFFIKATFPVLYHKTIKEWWPSNDSRGQESSQGGGSVRT